MKKKTIEMIVNYSLNSPSEDKLIEFTKTIDTCDNCKYSTIKLYLFTGNKYDFCEAGCMKLKDYPNIPIDCPLEDIYKR